MSDNELLLALSDILETKVKAMMQAELQPIKDDIRDVKLDIENDIKPNIKLLAENYVPAAKKYENASSQIEAIQADIELMKKVIAEHSEKLQKIS